MRKFIAASIASLTLAVGGFAFAKDAAKTDPPKTADTAKTATTAKGDEGAKPVDTSMAAPAAPTPAAELDSADAKAFFKNASCSAATMGDDMKTPITTKSSVKAKKALGNFFYELKYSVKKAKGLAKGFDAIGYVTYSGGKWLFVGANSMGGTWNTSSSGPADGKVVFEGTSTNAMGDIPIRFTWAAAADGKKGYTFMVEGQMGGTWTAWTTDTCK